MKFEVTHPKIWNKLSEKNIPMSHKIKLYEKLGGAYRLGEDAGEQVFNKMTELLRYKLKEVNSCETCGMSGMNINEESEFPPKFLTVEKPFNVGNTTVNSGEYTYYGEEDGNYIYQTKNDSVKFSSDDLNKCIEQGLMNTDDYVDASTDTAFAPAYNPLRENLVDDIYDALMKVPGFSKLGMDQQGRISMQVLKLFKSAGLRESKTQLSETKFYAFWNGKKVEIDGTSLWDAKQKAIIKLGVPKSKVGLLAVVNAHEHDGGSFQFNESNDMQRVSKTDIEYIAPTTYGGYDNAMFVIAKRNTSNMRGTQDPYIMLIADKTGKVIQTIGSHPSVYGAKQYAKNHKFISE